MRARNEKQQTVQSLSPEPAASRPPSADAVAPFGEPEHEWVDAADLSQAQARVVRKLGLLLPGVVRVVEIRRLGINPPRWRVSLAEATEEPGAASVVEAGTTASTLRAHLSFDTGDVGLIYQLRPRRIRLAVDLLELQRGGPEGGSHDVP